MMVSGTILKTSSFNSISLDLGPDVIWGLGEFSTGSSWQSCCTSLGFTEFFNNVRSSFCCSTRAEKHLVPDPVPLCTPIVSGVLGEHRDLGSMWLLLFNNFYQLSIFFSLSITYARSALSVALTFSHKSDSSKDCIKWTFFFIISSISGRILEYKNGWQPLPFITLHWISSN